VFFKERKEDNMAKKLIILSVSMNLGAVLLLLLIPPPPPTLLILVSVIVGGALGIIGLINYYS